jgi:hypothetical protein
MLWKKVAQEGESKCLGEKERLGRWRGDIVECTRMYKGEGFPMKATPFIQGALNIPR